MKVAQEKIHVEELLSFYSKDHLESYRHRPQILAEQLKDLETISLLAHSQFADIVVDLRKKSLQYDKTFKACDKLAKEISGEIKFRRNVSNKDFAYSIHSLSAQSLLSQFPQRRVLTELKLKFLQSEGVDESSWENWFCPEEKVLLIRDEKSQLQIKLGIRLLEEKPPTLTWDIYDVTTNSHHHPQLFYFLREYAHWMRLNNSEWESKLISKLEQIIKNLPAIFVFIALRNEVRKREGEVDKETFVLTPAKNASIKYMWKFNLFEHLEQSKVQFFINQTQIFWLQFKEGAYSGQIHIKSFGKEIPLCHAQAIQLKNRSFLHDFSMKVQEYCATIQKFGDKYSNLDSKIVLFLNIEGQLWRPEGLPIRQEERIFYSDGIWALIASQIGVIIKIDDDMSLTYPQFQRGFFNHLLPRLSLADLLIHIHLRNEIIRWNKEYEFKVYRVSYLDKYEDVVYEFRSYKYSEQQRIFKITRQQEESMHMMNEANDNFVLILKVAADFTRVSFSAYKAMEGPQQQQKITDNFMPRRWKEYRDKVKDRYHWRKICECITYLCKCYLVERSYNRRMTEEQRKMTVYSFR